MNDMNEMIMKVEDFCKMSDELISDCMKLAMDEDAIGLMTDIPPKSFELMQNAMKLYEASKEITIGQAKMLVDMNDKLDKVLEKLEK